MTAPDGTEAPPEGWGGRGLDAGSAPDWDAVEHAPLDELMDVIRPGGLAPQKAPRIQNALRHVREATGGRYDLDFLAAMEPRAARDWLTQVPGIGKKTASIVLLFCFGLPLMPVDTHVERVSRRIGLVPPKAGPDEQHEIYWHLLAPEDVHPAHVLLIQHGRKTCDARKPACDRCPLAPRCRLPRLEGAVAQAWATALPRLRRRRSAGMGGGPPARAARYARPMMIGGGPAGQERPARLLLVDDDSNLLVVLAEQLRDDGYDVATARDGVEALRRLEGGWPDLAIIDMMMPRLDGLSLAREIKARADLPIIVLSAIDAADSKAELLDEVAEDYVTKPYHYPELRARINRVLRRLGDRLPGQRVVVGPALVLELHRRTATVNGVEVVLTPIESRLLYALAANLGQTVSTETLLLRGWADTEDADPSYVWVSMRRLRTKLEVDPNHPRHLVTVRGVGYRLEVEPT